MSTGEHFTANQGRRRQAGASRRPCERLVRGARTGRCAGTHKTQPRLAPFPCPKKTPAEARLEFGLEGGVRGTPSARCRAPAQSLVMEEPWRRDNALLDCDQRRTLWELTWRCPVSRHDWLIPPCAPSAGGAAREAKYDLGGVPNSLNHCRRHIASGFPSRPRER